MSYDPQKHHRRSIRLKDYDYSQDGAYFITICTQNRECLFGEEHDGLIKLSAAGQLVSDDWQRLSTFHPHLEVDTFIIMPNHLHGILALDHVSDQQASIGEI